MSDTTTTTIPVEEHAVTASVTTPTGRVDVISGATAPAIAADAGFYRKNPDTEAFEFEPDLRKLMSYFRAASPVVSANPNGGTSLSVGTGIRGYNLNGGWVWCFSSTDAIAKGIAAPVATPVAPVEETPTNTPTAS